MSYIYGMDKIPECYVEVGHFQAKFIGHFSPKYFLLSLLGCLWWRHLAVQVETTKNQGLYNKPSAALHPGALAAGTLPQYNTMCLCVCV